MTENMLLGKAQFPKKEEVLKVLDGLTYSERRTIAQKFGKEYGGRPGFDEFLQEIRDHSPPAIPVIQVEEDGEDGGLEEILPPQKRNVSKHIHEEYFALFAAGTANKKKIFQEEIRTTSRTFKQKVVKELVRLETDDKALVAEVLVGVPQVQRKLIENMMKARRVEALDELAMTMVLKVGPDYVCSWIHGCSTNCVREFLSRRGRLKQCPLLRWDKIARYHPEYFVECIEKDLKKKRLKVIGEKSIANATAGELLEVSGLYQDVWTMWRTIGKYQERDNNKGAWNTYLEQPGSTSKLLELEAEYPC